MEIDNLKYIVGKAETGKPAVIRFFGSVDSESTRYFNEEFLWLQNAVQPSKIVVMINSEGGSVLYGMSTFSVIQSCPIEVDCIVEGIAASMGSVIWAAGDNLYMHDYSLLMIHNPFNSNRANDGEPADASSMQTVNAFRSQLETIYRKRFGMTQEQVKEIMDGADGADGTFFTAKDAVKAGLIPSGNVLKTSKAVRDKVKNQINGIDDATSLRDIMSSVSAEIDENKLIEEMSAIHNQSGNSQIQKPNIENKMEEQVLEAISAQLGFSKDAQTDAVKARIAELVKAESALKDIQGKNTALEIKCKGVETELANTKNELEQAQASLKEYRDAEAAAHEAEINAFIASAIEAGKIEAASKESWVKLAHDDFETVKATIASIKARENILDNIAQDANNVQSVQDGMTETERELNEKVKTVCGASFALKKF